MVQPIFRKKGFPQHRFPAQSGPPGPDNPPFGKRSWLPIVLASWVTVSVPVWQTFQIPDAPPTPTARAWLPNVLASWEPEPQPIQKRRFAPQVAAAQVDNPPFGAKNYQSTRLWEIETWPAQKQRVQAQPTADQPFGAHPWLLIEWVDDDVPQQARRFIPQSGVTVVNQPFNRQWLPIVQSSWEPEPARAVDKRFTPQVQVTADNPPPTSRPWLQSVLQSWEVSWSAQAADITSQGTPAQVDNPPFGLRPYLTWILPTWETTWNAQAKATMGWLPDGPTPPVTATTIYPIAMFPIGMGWR